MSAHRYDDPFRVVHAPKLVIALATEERPGVAATDEVPPDMLSVLLRRSWFSEQPFRRVLRRGTSVLGRARATSERMIRAMDLSNLHASVRAAREKFEEPPPPGGAKPIVPLTDYFEDETHALLRQVVREIRRAHPTVFAKYAEVRWPGL